MIAAVAQLWRLWQEWRERRRWQRDDLMVQLEKGWFLNKERE